MRRGDAGTWGHGEIGTRGRAVTRGRDKQTTPDFFAEFVKNMDNFNFGGQEKGTA